MTPEVLIENPLWMVTCYQAEIPAGRTTGAVVSFAGVRWRFGPDAMVEEFKASLDPHPVHQIFIMDRKRSYWNNDGFEEVLAVINAKLAALGVERVGLLGMSAGASGAVLFSDRIDHVDRVLAFVPQYSLSSPIVWLYEPRRIRQRLRISPFRWRRFSATRHSKREIAIFYGDQWDKVHRKLFIRAGFAVAEMPGYDHGVAGQMRILKTLQPLMRRFCNFNRPWPAFDIVSNAVAEAKHLPAPEPTVGPFAKGLKGVKLEKQ